MNGTLEFTSLPLIEVALKRVARAHVPISLPYVLDLKEKLPARFDLIRDLDFVEPPPGAAAPAMYSIPSLGGCRLIDSRMGISVSIQPDMMVTRWLATERASYPRFAELRRAADEVVTAIGSLGIGAFDTQLVSLAYANRIPATIQEGRVQPGPWPLSEAWTPRALRDEEQTFETQSVLRGADQIDRRVLVQSHEDRDGSRWYLFLTVAGKTIEEGESLADCEGAVHRALIDWFPRLLSEEARVAFGLQS